LDTIRKDEDDDSKGLVPVDDGRRHRFPDQADGLVDGELFMVGGVVVINEHGVAVGRGIDCILDPGVVSWPTPTDIQPITS